MSDHIILSGNNCFNLNETYTPSTEEIDTTSNVAPDLDKYVEKITTVGGVSLEQSTDNLQDYIYDTNQTLKQKVVAMDNAIASKQPELLPAQEAAVNSGINSTKVENYDSHLVNTNNPHNVTKQQLRLENVINTGDSATPVENGTDKFTTGGAYTLKSNLETSINDTDTKINNHIIDTDNPHSVTKSQVGLGNVDNKSEATIKSDFTGEIAANNENFVLGKDVYTHTSNTSNPHNVTKEQIGLGNVDNKSESTIKLDFTGSIAAENEGFVLGKDVYAHTSDEDNPHNVTAVQVGLGNVANTGDSNTPIENGTDKFTTGGAFTLKTTLEQSISDESTIRQNQDGVLQRNINAEALARQQADTMLQGNINTKVGIIILNNIELNNAQWYPNDPTSEFNYYAYYCVYQNDALKGAQIVNVLFSIGQVLSNTYCSTQVVNNETGEITFYGDDNSTAIIPTIQIIK